MRSLEKIKEFVRDMSHAVLELLFPNGVVCFVCKIGVPENGSICEECIEKLPRMKGPLCAVCGGMADFWDEDEKCSYCMSRKFSFEKARSVFAYDGKMVKIIYGLKFGAAPYLAESLATAMLPLVASFSPDYIVPVPLHEKRLKERGYNQSEKLCEAIVAVSEASHMGIIKINALKRGINTKRQMKLSRKQRVLQMQKNVFELTESAACLEGKHVVLIDDVYTTGSTVDACARALRAVAARVDIVTVCMAGKGKVRI